MKRCLLLASGIFVAAISLAQQDGPDLSKLPPILRKSMLAHRTSRYTGERRVEFKKGADRVRHVEYIIKDGRRTRVEFPDDSAYHGQVIVDNGTQRMHYFPDRNEIEVEPARDRDSKHVRFRPDGSDRPDPVIGVTDGGMIAGFKTQLVTISDKSGNLMQKVWVEPKSGVALKRVLFDRVGTQNGYYEFTKINFNPVFAPGDFTIDRRGAVIITPEIQSRRGAQKLGLSQVTVPQSSGFVLENARIIHPDKQDVLLQTYISDNARFSLFQMRGEIDPNRLQKLARGRLSTYSWKRGQESFALIGNLSDDQLRQIARTLGDG